MDKSLDAVSLMAILTGGDEVALLDPRPPAAFQAGHLLLAVNTPLDKLGAVIGDLVPRAGTPIMLCDDGTEAMQGAALLESQGYRNVARLEGGVAGWAAAGFEVFAGTYSINNIFALYVERDAGTPRMTAEALQARRDAGEAVVVVDSRPFDEYHDQSLPGAVNLPIAELAYRVKDLVPDEETPITVTCGGRARAVLGCQSLIDAGLRNPLSAVYYGTSGWDLAGYPLAVGLDRVPGPVSARSRVWAAAAAARFAVRGLDHDGLAAWRAEAEARTLYLIDVRERGQFEAGHIPGSRWIPGGQLVGVTEDHIATRGARLCLIDDGDIRAPMTASWMRRMGWPEVAILAGGIPAWREAGLALETAAPLPPAAPEPSGEAVQTVARHAAIRHTIKTREALLGQFEKDPTLIFRA